MSRATVAEPRVQSAFVVRECTLICRTASLPPAANLRELRERLAVCPQASLYHHYCETKLRPSFDDPEYPNDFAAWSARALNDRVIAERLGIVNGFDYQDLEHLRSDTLEIIDERLAESQLVPWAPRGEHFEFLQAMTVVFDTGATLHGLSDLSRSLEGMTPGSVYFHFVEARRRQKLGLDDFSTWLSSWGKAPSELLKELHGIDVHFLTLEDIRERVLAAVRRHEHDGAHP
jgi:hypothetical protein